MKKLLSLVLFFSLTINAATWEFTHFKDHESVMREDFLRTLQQLFGISIFIETGTGGGSTTERAARVFDTVYSVEIQPDAFLAAQKRLQNYKNVSLHKDDSVNGLKTILKTIDPHKKTLFFLDAHYNGVINGKGATNTPAMEELAVIVASDLDNPVIVIDDARTFRTRKEQEYDFSLYHCDQVFDYPSVAEVVRFIQKNKPNYKAYVYGDLIICYAEDIQVSPLIQFMTNDMIYNNIISYDFEYAKSHMNFKVSKQEKEAVSFIFDTNILGAPITYNKFFEMWKRLMNFSQD